MTDSTEAMASGSLDEEPPPPLKQILTRMNTDPPTYEDVTTGNEKTSVTIETSTGSDRPIFPSYPNAGNFIS